MTTLKQVEANRRNAERSTGPKTAEGKRRASRNSVIHGLAGKGIVLPEHDEAVVAKRIADLEIGVESLDEQQMFWANIVAVESVRVVSCQREQNILRIQLAEDAEEFWDDKRRIAAETLAKGLPKSPGLVMRQLLMTLQGCELMIERWELLLGVLDAGEPWTERQRSMALDLLGVEPDLRVGRTRIDSDESQTPLDRQREVAQEQIAQLTTRRDSAKFQARDERTRENAMLGVGEPDDALVRLRRYEAACFRRYKLALDWLKDTVVFLPETSETEAETETAFTPPPEKVAVPPDPAALEKKLEAIRQLQKTSSDREPSAIDSLANSDLSELAKSPEKMREFREKLGKMSVPPGDRKAFLESTLASMKLTLASMSNVDVLPIAVGG